MSGLKSLIKAIKFNALDYLLKPIDIDERKNSVQKVKNKIFAQKENQLLRNLVTNLQLEDAEKKIALPQENEVVFVPIKEIIRCQAESNYTRFYLLSDRSLLISRTLKEFDQALSEYNFVRVHQSHLVNTKQIASYVKQDGGYLKMLDGTSVPIARSRKDVISHILYNF
ncbi:MAG: response regulator transcription factor [Bacteroidetes bacterium]|nr:response regulator transcription factor [Bacteroidota bacterium]